ncbi:MAG: 16S rRNA (cytosine(967)-C(5))-methyltransferase RsmB [Gammaproteobacteria bacterium]|nr:16S rRNA (cytosine(967)-C(5))-methyltransferase RsmB [Gammaproteobacteria bacterium]
MPTKPDQQRATAARMLAAVVSHRQTSDQVLGRFPADPLTRDLFYGAMRHYFTLTRAVNAELTKPLRDKDEIIGFLLIVGAYQLRHTRIPDHAAIHATVDACKALKKTSVSGLVNAVLRTLQRRPDQTERSFSSVEDEFPEWMVGLIRRDFPDIADDILNASQQRAPLTLRINRRRSTTEGYRALLDAQGIGYAPAFRDECLVLDEPIATAALPGFDEGLVAIQDAGAGFVVDLLACQSGDRVLDACAAPGGKLFHLLESHPDIHPIGVEKSARRMQRLHMEARRLGHRPATHTADATSLDWWDGMPFDAVLIDAPCSGSGTLRRHPDIKILRTEADLAGYAQLQSALLSNLWRTLRLGGSLLYCTCSLFAEENDAVIADFVRATDNATVRNIAIPTGVERKFGWQVLPTNRTTDGFYFSLLNKGTA